MSAPQSSLFRRYQGEQPRFSQQEKLRGAWKPALWCGVARWIMIIFFLACGFVLCVLPLTVNTRVRWEAHRPLHFSVEASWES